ncbi:MAG: threonyl-tRNA synthetase editing domain-containing protein [Methanofollis sp.]|uniref:threonyl-tRNA synthetase editing domain-containing protein n=1 Tax=Methanofollis sp. TaxID=2052835 RepID=UPI00261816FD|nr:threonyl-tRNA synthetase editing domain-containing protein [Methanofollis sp.]MDD4254663.1 threonyl-tRNA synthetase editing domain-containing protein [Methanofollis sp.]
MRIVSIHADSMHYRATKKTPFAEPLDEKEGGMEECVVLFCCVEEMDRLDPAAVVGKAARNVLARMAMLKAQRAIVYPYAHLASDLSDPSTALHILDGLADALREAGIEVRRAPFGWYKKFDLAGKGHPLADLSMTICPFDGTACGPVCPHCRHPLKGAETPGRP